MSILNLLAKKHDEWIRIAKSLGAGEFSEDIVQEMYIRMSKYVKNTERIMYGNDVNQGYVYMIIKNLTYDLNKAQVKSSEMIVKGITLEALNVQEDEFDDTIDQLNDLVKSDTCNWNPYDKIVFNYVYKEGISMRELSRESGISLRSICNTIKNAKERIKEAAEKKGIERIG